MFNRHKAIADALHFLSDACDGATSADGIGFNKLDSRRGKSLWRESTMRGLTTQQEEAALKLLSKYHAQLERAGIVLMERVP